MCADSDCLQASDFITYFISQLLPEALSVLAPTHYTWHMALDANLADSDI